MLGYFCIFIDICNDGWLVEEFRFVVSFVFSYNVVDVFGMFYEGGNVVFVGSGYKGIYFGVFCFWSFDLNLLDLIFNCSDELVIDVVGD